MRFNNRKHLANAFNLREGLIGQCAYEKSRILLTNVPSDYVQISSGLGEAAPQNIIVLPALFEGDVKAVIELATLGDFNETQQAFLDQVLVSIGFVLSTIADNMRTEGLLKQSQLLTSGTAGSSRKNSPRPTTAWSNRPPRCANPRNCCAPSRKSCNRPTPSWRRRPSCSPSRTLRWRARTARSSRPS